MPFIMATPGESSQPSPGGAPPSSSGEQAPGFTPPEMSGVDLDEGFPMGLSLGDMPCTKALWEWAQNFGRPVVV